MQFPDGRERDRLDDRSIHGLLLHRQSNIACGTVRLIMPSRDTAEPPTSFYELCNPNGRFPVETTAEISRLATSKVHRLLCESFPDTRLVVNAASSILPHITISLIGFIIQTAIREGITHLCAVMKPSLMRLLSRFGMHFRPIGDMVEYHGWRQPCFIPLTALEEIGEEQPRVWDIVTDYGRIFEQARAVKVA